MKTSSKATIGLLAAASAVAAAAMLHGAGKFEWSPFYVWVLSPYLVLGLIFVLPVTQSDTRSVAGCSAAAVVLAFTALIYVDAMWISVSSTSALIFVFTPALLFMGGLIVWGLVWFVLKSRAAKQ